MTGRFVRGECVDGMESKSDEVLSEILFCWIGYLVRRLLQPGFTNTL